MKKNINRIFRRHMSVFRRNPVTEQIVVFASDRDNRPRQTIDSSKVKQFSHEQPEHLETCPFCTGNESKTPPTLFEIKDPGTGKWKTRVVNNKFPAVMPPRKNTSADEEHKLLIHSNMLNAERPAIGYHEVIIESPRHNAVTSKGKREDIKRLVLSWWNRGNALKDDPSIQHVLYFKNQGSVAGASLVHPHAQIVALPFVSRDVRVGQLSNLNYFLDNGISVFQKMIEEEMFARDKYNDGQDDGYRIIEENDNFISIIPYAAISPFNLWIIPLYPSAHFTSITMQELDSFSEILWSSLRRLDIVLNEPDFNLLIKSAPLQHRHKQAAFNANTYFRWYCSITPRLGAGAMAGFELGSGIFSNGNLPEDDAHALRECMPEDFNRFSRSSSRNFDFH